MINQDTIQILQFNQILEAVKERAIGDYTKELMGKMSFGTRLIEVETRQQETKEARLILDSHQQVPFMGLIQIKRLMVEADRGMILLPRELVEVADFLRSTVLIKKFFEKNQFQTPLLYQYSLSFGQFTEIEDSIYSKIQHQQLIDDASKNFRRVRRQIALVEREIEEKLQKFIKHPNNQTMLQERLIVKKGDHYTVPVKASFKNKIPGTLIEQSSKGQTAFIEPNGVSKLNEKLAMLKAEEIAEEYQILAELTGLLSEQTKEINEAIESVTAFDCIFARAKYSRDIEGQTPEVNQEEKISIIEGRHPLLPNTAIPLDFQLGEAYRGLVITGANAGGKTLVLKTIGLLTLMTMYGLQIPASSKSNIPVVNHLFVDIGDQQNLENALSTFSGHMKNVSQILNQAGRHTLVLLDEIGSGTEPNEGAAIGIAVMEELYRKGSLIVSTTHYGEIKEFAKKHPDFMPAAMSFDKETLTPLYQLQVGEIGESQALWIAQKMAVSHQVLEKAKIYMSNKDYPSEKIEFQAKERKNLIKEPVDKTTCFAKGDRVLLTETKEIGLIFEDLGQEEVLVYVKNSKRSIHRKRLVIQGYAKDLYPVDYDLESLFVDFHVRKQEKDLNRGSKKAHKELDKAAKSRRIE